MKPMKRKVTVIRIEDPDTLRLVSDEMQAEHSRNATDVARRLIRDGALFRSRNRQPHAAAPAVAS